MDAITWIHLPYLTTRINKSEADNISVLSFQVKIPNIYLIEIVFKLSCWLSAVSTHQAISGQFKIVHKGMHIFCNLSPDVIHTMASEIQHISVHLVLTQWGRVTICVSKLAIIGSDNGLSPGRRQGIIWTNAGILLIGPLGTNFSEILIEIDVFSKWIWKCRLRNVVHLSRPQCVNSHPRAIPFTQIPSSFLSFINVGNNPLCEKIFAWAHI